MDLKDDMVKKIQQSLAAEGFTEIELKHLGLHYDSGPHTHDRHTARIVIRGVLEVIEKDGAKKTFKIGERADFAPGTTHTERGLGTDFSIVVGYK